MSALTHPFRLFGAAFQAVRSRRQLAAMDDRMLSDIGLSRVDALAEAARAPWDVGPLMPLRATPRLRTVDGCDLLGGKPCAPAA